MFIHRRKPFDVVGGKESPEGVIRPRRRFLKVAAGAVATAAGLGYGGWRWYRGSDAAVLTAGKTSDPPGTSRYPAARDSRFAYGRPQTDEAEAARYTNFYEFSALKSTWRYVDNFQTQPWKVQINGLCRQRMTLDVDDLLSRYASALSERQYRHRCVERWAMAVPWTGIPLAALIRDADPLPTATHVRFVSFYRRDQAPGMQSWSDLPWPYCEGLTMAEATNELVFLATGMYGHPLLKQHGAPLRLVVPWKYGYKSIKSIQRIDFVDREPATFWSSVAPTMYPFESNVEPDVPRPWRQTTEQMLGTGEEYPTQLYNGYGEYVAHLYRKSQAT